MQKKVSIKVISEFIFFLQYKHYLKMNTQMSIIILESVFSMCVPVRMWSKSRESSINSAAVKKKKKSITL